jgi:hypothetical protein
MSEKKRVTKVRVGTLREQGTEKDLSAASAAECMSMVWPLTLDAWAFTGGEVAESRLLRHVVAVRRKKR